MDNNGYLLADVCQSFPTNYLKNRLVSPSEKPHIKYNKTSYFSRDSLPFKEKLKKCASPICLAYFDLFNLHKKRGGPACARIQGKCKS